MTATRLPASWMNALDPAAGARRSRWTAAPAGAPRCPDISRRSRPTSGQTVSVPSSFRRGELPRRLRAPFARNVIPGAPMRRIGLAVLALSIALAPLASEAQELKAGKVYRIGVLLSDGSPLWNPFLDAFRWELRELGYVEGQSVVLEFRSPEGRPERLPDLAAELVRLKVDVILAQSNPAIAAAQKVTSAIPIVMVIAPDPVASGFAASLSWPAGNITGL